MNLADLFLHELERQGTVPQSIEMLGTELARKLKETQHTLASIAAMYVKTYYELDDLKKRQPEQTTLPRQCRDIAP